MKEEETRAKIGFKVKDQVGRRDKRNGTVREEGRRRRRRRDATFVLGREDRVETKHKKNK